MTFLSTLASTKSDSAVITVIIVNWGLLGIIQRKGSVYFQEKVLEKTGLQKLSSKT